MVDNFLDTYSTTHKGTGINYDAVSDNQQLAKELQNPLTWKLKKKRKKSKVYS